MIKPKSKPEPKPEPKKEPKQDWIDFLMPLNYTKVHLIDDDPDYERAYKPFMINRSLSQFPDTILLANEMNFYRDLDPRLQHDFLFHTISRRKRFGKWAKKESNDNIELIQEAYNLSYRKAARALVYLTDDQIQQIRDYFDKGGSTRSKRT